MSARLDSSESHQLPTSPGVRFYTQHRVVSFPMALPGVSTLSQSLKALGLNTREAYANEEWRLFAPDTIQTCIAARAAGIQLPSPALRYFDRSILPSPLFLAQEATIDLLTTNRRAFVLNGMGTGKTRAATISFAYLHSARLAKKLLVIAPLSVLSLVWAREILTSAPHLRVAILHGSARKRKELLASKDDYDVYLLNFDGLKVVFDDLIKSVDIDTVCIDEIPAFRTPSAQRTKLAIKFAASRTRVWGMTGSPMPHSPMDAWSQIKIVNPSNMPISYHAMREQCMYKATQFLWKPRPHATERVFSLMQPAVRFSLDSVTELPPVVFLPVEVSQSPAQTKVYKELVSHMYSDFKNNKITAVNSGVLLNKLLQVSIGLVYSNDGVADLNAEDRLDTIIRTISESDSKVIVFVPYIHAMRRIFDHIKNAGFSVCEIHGDVPSKERTVVFQSFQNEADPKVLVAHPACMAHGLTLTAADTVIWAAPVSSLEIFEQANARITRVGQTRKQRVVMLYSTPVERQVYSRLADRQDAQNMLLDMFASKTMDWLS